MAVLVGRLQAVQPALIVLKATGGSHRAGVAARATAALPLVVVNPHTRQSAPDMSPCPAPSGGRGKVIQERTAGDHPPRQTLE
jgi:hypothetical protein